MTEDRMISGESFRTAPAIRGEELPPEARRMQRILVLSAARALDLTHDEATRWYIALIHSKGLEGAAFELAEVLVSAELVRWEPEADPAPAVVYDFLSKLQSRREVEAEREVQQSIPIPVRVDSTPSSAISAESTDGMSMVSYLGTDDRAIGLNVYKAMVNLAIAIGLDVNEAVEWRGSIWHRAMGRVRTGLSSREVTERLEKLEHAGELKILGKQQAEIDAIYAEKLADLMAALEPVPNACVRIGAFMVIKYEGPSGPVILSRTLSFTEVMAMERFPEIQSNPSKALEALAAVVATLEDTDHSLRKAT
jgi:hypothetical protein